MTTEQMIAWLIIEGWNPTSDGDLYHRGSNRYASVDGVAEFGELGGYHRGLFDVDWNTWVSDYSLERVAKIYDAINKQENEDENQAT